MYVKNTLFNAYLVEIRVKVEHGIGMLKGNFQNLRNLNVLI
jgi:hypothetical protein